MTVKGSVGEVSSLLPEAVYGADLIDATHLLALNRAKFGEVHRVEPKFPISPNF